MYNFFEERKEQKNVFENSEKKVDSNFGFDFGLVLVWARFITLKKLNIVETIQSLNTASEISTSAVSAYNKTASAFPD